MRDYYDATDLPDHDVLTDDHLAYHYPAPDDDRADDDFYDDPADDHDGIVEYDIHNDFYVKFVHHGPGHVDHFILKYDEHNGP